MPERTPIVVTLMLALLGFAGAAPAIDLIPDFFRKDEGRTLWESRDQWVKLVPQDELPGGGAPPPNDHPVVLDAGELKTVLGSITLWREGGGLFVNEQEEIPLFATQQASLLGRKLADALAEARPGEDVVFALTGLKSQFVVANERYSTSGRAFYAGGRLHLIIGDMHRTYTRGKELDASGFEQGVDRRIYPHRPGRREKARSHPARMSSAEGVDFYESSEGLRGDWLVIDIPTVLARVQQESIPDAVARETRRVKEEAAQLAIERRQMREELARMRKKMEDLREGEAAGGSLEERLSRLEHLREKELITEEEYQAKRREILDEI